jgi:uncharacterized membrane protein
MRGRNRRESFALRRPVGYRTRNSHVPETCMAEAQPSYRAGAVRPMECLREGLELIKGQYWLFVGITLVGVLLASMVPFGLIAGPMFCGIYYCLLRRDRGQSVKFEMLFKGFDHFVQSLIATLIMMIPLVVIAIPGYIVVFAVMFASMPGPTPPGAPAPPPPSMGPFFAAYAVFLLVLLAVSVVVQVLCFFVYPLIVDRKLSGVQALKTSLAAARANLGGVFGLVLLSFLMVFVGALACYVGAIFVMPIHYAAVAVAYRKVFPDGASEPPVRTPEERDYDDQLELDDRPPEKPEGEGPPV